MFEYQSSLHEKIMHAKRLMREYEPPEGYSLSFSGGKDSVVMLDLAKRAGVKYTAKFLTTTIEHPETLEFIKNFPELEIVPPRATISDLIVKKGFPPMRRYRYCTGELKSRAGAGYFNLIGIRAEESRKRAAYTQVKDTGSDRHLYPIFDWTEKDIWLYIGRYRLPYHPLYDIGYRRVGCVLCPFSSKKMLERELKAYPEIVEMYRSSCIKAYESKVAAGKIYYDINSGEELFQWWLGCITNK